MKNILAVKNIEKYYGNKDNVTKVLDDISFSIDKGEFIGIMGPSGSGKTTLLNCISTIDSVTTGSIEIEGCDITRLKGKKLDKFRMKSLGFIFQDFNLLDTLTAYENISLALTIGGMKGKEIKDIIEKAATNLGINDVLDKYPYEMSGGQRQRVAAARAIVTNPSLILADEPTGALDSKSSSELLNCLKEMNEKFNVTVIMVTHDPFSASYSKKVIFIKDGKLNARIDSGGNRKEFYNNIMNLLTSMGGEVNELI